MTLDQLFTRFRSDIDDQRIPYLWSDDDLEVYFNWALEELAKEARYFFDTSTYLNLTVTADDPKITATSANKLARILDVQRAILDSTNRKLDIKYMAQADTVAVDDDYGLRLSSPVSWEDSTGTPQILVMDYYNDGSIRLGPIPGAADTVSLWAYRLPLDYVSYNASKNLTLDELVEISEFSHELTLIQGMKAKAYQKEDPEARDDDLAEQAFTLFNTELAKIKRDLNKRRHPVGQIRYGGI